MFVHVQFPKPADNVKVEYNEFVDLIFKRDLGHISYASLVTPAVKETADVDIFVSYFDTELQILLLILILILILI